MCGSRKTFAYALATWLCAAALSGAAHANPLPLPDHARYAIKHFGERFGLGAVTVTSLAQDNQGLLWIGTETGLFRYDGAGITHFGRDEGLRGEIVQLVLAAPDGSLWVRTRKGISRLEHENFSNLSLPEDAGGLRDVYQSFAVDRTGMVFAATQRGLISIDPKGASRIYGKADGFPGLEVDAVVCSPDDTIWFASGEKIGFFRGSGRAQIISSLQLGEDRIVALLPTPDRKLWIRTTHRVGILNTQSGASAQTWFDQGIPGANGLGGPSLDRHGNLLLPTERGMYQRIGNDWKVIDHKSGLTSNAITAVLEDREGGIWIGTAGAGLDHWPGSKQWSGWTDTEGLPDALVLSVVRDRQSRLWVSTNTALTLWNAATRRWQTWTSNGLAGSGARQLLLAPDGAVWALFSSKGVFRFDASSPHPQAERVPSIASWQPRRIAVAPDGVVWADGVNSLHTIQYEYGHFFVHEQPVPAAEAGTTDAVSVSPNGVLWTGGPKGLARWAKGRWRHFDEKDGLLSTNVVMVRAASDDEAWVGYPDEGAITRIRISDNGAASTKHFQKGMCGMGLDAKGNAWLEMEEGVGVVSPQGQLTTFTQGNGLLWNDLNCDAMWQESDGSILLGTSKGLARYDPGQEAPGLSQPTAVLTTVLFGNVDRSGEQAPSVAYADRTFVAHFAAPIFRDPDHVSCRYRLRGLEADFTETTLREARYSSLPAGGYTFEVSCGSDALGWSAVKSYSFEIRPPWWRTWWAELLALGLLAFAVREIVRYRTRRNRQERERLETAVAERSAALAQANRELQEASLSDPLTGVRNRRFFDTTISADASQAVRAYRSEAPSYSRDHRDLIFYLVDIDHFKEVNDHYGHQAGDHLLIDISHRLAKIVRESDFLIRWGGEEFLIVCRSAAREDAPRMAERILSVIGSAEYDLGGGCVVRRTCSVGWAPFPWLPPSDAVWSVDDVLRLADQGLYLSKQRGKNQATGILPAANIAAGSQYTEFEQLAKAGIIREVRTMGPQLGTSAFSAHQ